VSKSASRAAFGGKTMFYTNSVVRLSDAIGGCQAPSLCSALIVVKGFECLAPSQITVNGKMDFPCPIRQKYAGGIKKSVYRDGSLKAETIPYDGSLCVRCNWSRYYPIPSPLLVPLSVQSPENNRYKKRRFLVRAFRGVACGIAKGYRFRWFVLTESDTAIALNIDFGLELNKFITWLRYYCPDFAYIIVEHRQGDKKRRNWHTISYGSDKLPVLKMRNYWLKNYKSTITGMAEIVDIKRSVFYVSDYVSGEGFVRSWCSQNWVFKGWLGFSKRYKAQYGVYPNYDDLENLSCMDKLSRSCSLIWMAESGFIDELASMVDVKGDNGRVDAIEGCCRS